MYILPGPGLMLIMDFRPCSLSLLGTPYSHTLAISQTLEDIIVITTKAFDKRQLAAFSWVTSDRKRCQTGFFKEVVFGAFSVIVRLVSDYSIATRYFKIVHIWNPQISTIVYLSRFSLSSKFDNWTQNQKYSVLGKPKYTETLDIISYHYITFSMI
jgi:hypothetical protein